MSPAADPVLPRLAWTDHLVALVGRSEAAAARLAAGAAQRRDEVAAAARREQARCSARLDGSPLEDATADAVDAREADGQPAVDPPEPTRPDADGPDLALPGGRPEAGGPDPTRPGAGEPGLALPGAGLPGGAGAGQGSWARALKLDAMPTQDVAAVEYADLLACHDAEGDLAGQVFEAPETVLVELHRVLCRGLVAPGVAGRLRRTEQAVHDGVHGQVLYNTPAPGRLPDLFASLTSWLGDTSARYPALVVAGAVHERLLEWQPFEAANGRLARAAGRLVLRARGLDPQGLAVPERAFVADPLGYHREVAATIRRRGDLVPWLERFGEALCAALAAAADAVHGEPPAPPPPRASHHASRLAAGDDLTLADYAAAVGVRRETARADLEALERAGAVRLQPGTRGLRWRRV